MLEESPFQCVLHAGEPREEKLPGVPLAMHAHIHITMLHKFTSGIYMPLSTALNPRRAVCCHAIAAVNVMSSELRSDERKSQAIFGNVPKDPSHSGRIDLFELESCPPSPYSTWNKISACSHSHHKFRFRWAKTSSKDSLRATAEQHCCEKKRAARHCALQLAYVCNQECSREG